MRVTRPDGYEIDDAKDRLDVTLIHAFLTEHAYWAEGRTRATVERAIAHSLCFGVYALSGAQVGFARLVTDLTTAAHLTDVFILPGNRGLGLSKSLVAALIGHPELATVRRWTLSTADAHGLYAPFGFTAMQEPERQMMRMLPLA